MNKIISAIVVVIVVLLAGVFLFTFEVTAPEETPTPTATEITAVKTFNSQTLGIQFQYSFGMGATMVANVKEVGNKVYVYVGNVAPESGQFVEVFSKKIDETFEASIRRQILAQYSSDICKIEVTPSNIQSGYQAAEITYPRPENVAEPYTANRNLCNPKYDQTNGIRYFLYDPKHPTIFAYLDIGQYGILGYDNIPWQDTLTFIK